MNPVTEISAADALEYQTAIEQYQQCTALRRHDMAFVTTIQGAVLTIVGKEFLKPDLWAAVLSGVAFLLLLLGANSERRLAAYMAGYAKRASEIEQKYGLRVLQYGCREVASRRGLFSNGVVFPTYYLLFAAAWAVLWLVHLLT